MSKVHQLYDDEKTAFLRGLDDGRAAKSRRDALTPYLRVGIDDYAQGYRSGFFSRTVVAESPKIGERGAGAK